MKKLSVAFAALALSFLLVFGGCAFNQSAKVLNFIKETKEFYDTSNDYDVKLTVNDDLTFVLSVKCDEKALKDYKAEGGAMQYLGCHKSEFTTEWLGVTQNNTDYRHVVKLTGATVEINGKTEIFYLIASTSSKRGDSFYMTLVHNLDFEDYENNLYKIADSYTGYHIKGA